MKFTKEILALALSSLTGTFTIAGGINPDLPVYKPVSGVPGNLDSIGSDTLNNLEIEIEREATRYLTLRSPVASDLRLITVVIKGTDCLPT